MGSDFQINLVPDGAQPDLWLWSLEPLVVELFPPTDFVDVFGRHFDHVDRMETRLAILHNEVIRLRGRIGMIAEYLAAHYPAWLCQKMLWKIPPSHGDEQFTVLREMSCGEIFVPGGSNRRPC